LTCKFSKILRLLEIRWCFPTKFSGSHSCRMRHSDYNCRELLNIFENFLTFFIRWPEYTDISIGVSKIEGMMKVRSFVFSYSNNRYLSTEADLQIYCITAFFKTPEIVQEFYLIPTKICRISQNFSYLENWRRINCIYRIPKLCLRILGGDGLWASEQAKIKWGGDI